MQPGRRLLLVTLGTVVLLELVLQVGALLTWAVHGGEEATVADDPATTATILCVGDSFTFGIGASDRGLAYPAALERTLRTQHGRSVRVVNGGLAGQDSRDVLRRLAGQLERHRPTAACILVGTNDRWTKPQKLVVSADRPPASTSTWRWRWRTLRLIQWALQDAAEQPTPESEGERMAPAASADLFEQGLEHLTAGRHGDAIASFQSWSERHPERAWEAHRPLALAYREIGDVAGAQRFFALTESNFANRPSELTASRWVLALADANQAERAATIARELTDRYPDSGVLWWAIGCDSLGRGDHDAALAAFERAAPLLTHDALRSEETHLRRAELLAKTDPDAALAALCSAVQSNNQYRHAVRVLRKHATAVGEERARRLLATLAAGEPRHTILARLIDWTWAAEPAGFWLVLEQHVTQMVELCRMHDAVPVLVTYPLGEKVRAFHAQLGAKLAIPVAPVFERFAQELEVRPRTELLIPDGHCNDAGYAIMAEVVATTVNEHIQ